MSSTLLEIQTAIKSVMEGVGLRATATEPESPVAPAGWPVLAEMDDDVDFAGDCLYAFDLYITVPVSGDFNRAQSWLLPHLDQSGSKSVRAAMKANPTLNGTVTSHRFQPRITLSRMEVGGGQQLAATLRLEVYPA